MEGVSLLSLKLSVLKELSHFQGELPTREIPAVIKFQKSGLFQNRGNFNLAGFQGKMKLPIFGKFSGLNREFHPEILPIFGIPEFKSTLKPRECKVEGVSLLSLKLSVYLKLSHFEGELQSEKIPAVILIPKIWTILKPREF